MFLSLYDFFNSYYIFFYTLQNKLCSLLFVSSNEQSILLAILLFFFGLITVFTPCFLSLLPLAFSYINSKKNYGLNISLFITGLLTSFVILILFTNVFGFFLVVDELPVFSYLILIVVALDLMKIVNISKFNIPCRQYILTFFANNMFLQSYLMGLIIGSSSLPCNTSIIIVVTFLLNNLSSIFLSLLYLIIYLVGCAFPLLLTLIIKFDYNNFSLLLFVWKSIFPVSGSFLFVFSCLSLLKIIFI
uniref:Thiol:disulfi de interchange protein n=1 Tax=Symphyocladia marchantioides TaxID=88360 RepID=UPI0022FD4FA3|nr:Thiol:disulfi de interchange protein [Symphyocladia marchantioides]WAX03802.1 Thiol:disulfi de interchange protein [Symphyocladia marchantioides]